MQTGIKSDWWLRHETSPPFSICPPLQALFISAAYLFLSVCPLSVHLGFFFNQPHVFSLGLEWCERELREGLIRSVGTPPLPMHVGARASDNVKRIHAPT